MAGRLVAQLAGRMKPSGQSFKVWFRNLGDGGNVARLASIKMVATNLGMSI